MLDLRPYQNAAVNSVFSYFEEKEGNPLVVVPTAGGKSLILAEFVKRACTMYPGTRVLILTNVKELIQQDHAEIIGHWPDAPIGIYSAGLKKRDLQAQILVAGIQSIHKQAYNLAAAFDLVLIDEAHMIPRTSNTMFRKFLDDLRVINPYTKIIGLTATPFRLDSGLLHQGDGALFTDIAHDVDVQPLIDSGWLCPPVSVPSITQIDTSGVHTCGGEFIAGELEGAAMDQAVITAIAKETVDRGQGRRGWIVFGCGVDHCKALADAIRAHGVTVGTIFGDTPADERAATIEAFRRQELRCLCAMNVLTTGFSVKHVDLISVARPTKSTGLWIQIVGRGMRVSPGKDDCLVLDFGGNIARHGCVDKPKIKAPVKGEGEAPTKVCPECEAKVPIYARECPDCGEVFEFEGSKVTSKATTGALLSSQIQSKWLSVTGVSYALHEKPGSPPSLRVTYLCGMVAHKEWVCIQHSGFPRQKAIGWWSQRTMTPAPMTVAEALASAQHLRQPTEIQVKPSGKFTEITGARFV